MTALYVDPAMIPWASACIAAAIVIAVVCSLAFRAEQRRDAWGDSLRPDIAPLAEVPESEAVFDLAAMEAGEAARIGEAGL